MLGSRIHLRANTQIINSRRPIVSESWRKRLLDSGLVVKEKYIKVLLHGPKGHKDRNVLSKMRRLFKEKVERIRKV